MTKQEIVQARRELISEEIRRRGLSVVAKAAGKPDRQIKDMAAGRKAFGDGIAKEIGPKIRPDLPREWLVYPETETGNYPIPANDVRAPMIARENITEIPKAKSARELRIDELSKIAEQIDDDGLSELIGMAKLMRSQRPIGTKQTLSSSQ